MSKTAEVNLWRWWRKSVRPLKAEGLHIQRLESPLTPGCPDVELCLHGVQAWVELKSAARPKRPSTPVAPGVRDDQIRWHRRRAQAKGRAFFLVQVGSGARARRYLIAGGHAPRIDAMTEAALARYSLVPGDAPGVAILRRSCGLAGSWGSHDPAP